MFRVGGIDLNTNIARHVNRSNEELISLREGLGRGRALTVYGMTKGGTLADMVPFHGTASIFLQEVRVAKTMLRKPEHAFRVCVRGRDKLEVVGLPPRKTRQWLFRVRASL